MSASTARQALTGAKNRAADTLNQKASEVSLVGRSGDHAKLRRSEGTSSLADIPAWMDYLEAKGERKAEEQFDGDTRTGRAAQVGTVLTVVTLGLSIIIGILIYSQVQTALPTPSNNDLANASDNATGTFADAMELAPVIMIVLLAAVVLAVVQRFR